MDAVSWDSEEILLIYYTDKGACITGKYYGSILERLNEDTTEKRNRKLTKYVLLLYPPCTHPIVQIYVDPNDFYLFPKMKKERCSKVE